MSNGRTKSDKDVISAYQAAKSAQGGKSGRSVSDQALNYLFRLAMSPGYGQGMKPKKKKTLPTGHPKRGKFKRGGKVRRKAKY